MSYDNAVRYAIRTLQNPTALPVDVSELPNKDIVLRVNHAAVKRLPMVKRVAFASYLRDVADIIEVHGKVRCHIDMRGVDG